jgi:hypothetical protein
VAVSEEQRLAICRVYVPGAERVGTGFLIGPELVMTAAHVVCHKDDEHQPHDGKDIELRFDEGSKLGQVIHAAVMPGAFHHDKDWALLSVPAGAVTAKPIPLRPLSPGYQVPWSSFGFPKDENVLGTEHEGAVVTHNPRRMQLRSVLITDLPAGISGAPCIVDGHAVGLIVRTKKETTSETLYALGMSAIGRPLVEWTDAPYVVDVKLLLPAADDLLDFAAKELGFPGTKNTVAPDRKPGFVADAMMQWGMRMDHVPIAEAIGHLVKCLDVSAAESIAKYAARAWIDVRAVEHLRGVIASAPAIAIVNAPFPSELGRWYVHRAGCVGRPSPGLFRNCANVDAVSVSDPAELRRRIEDAIEMFMDEGSGDLAAFLKSHSHDRNPIVLVLQGVPTRAVFDEARKGLDPVRFVLLSGLTLVPATLAEYADAVIIKPELEGAVAESALQKREQAIGDVRKKYSYKKSKQEEL